MDKTVEIVMVLMVALATAAIVLFLIQGRSGSFSTFLDSQSNTGQCELWKSQGQCDKHTQCSWSRNDCTGDSANIQDSTDCGEGRFYCAKFETCMDQDSRNLCS